MWAFFCIGLFLHKTKSTMIYRSIDRYGVGSSVRRSIYLYIYIYKWCIWHIGCWRVHRRKSTPLYRVSEKKEAKGSNRVLSMFYETSYFFAAMLFQYEAIVAEEEDFSEMWYRESYLELTRSIQCPIEQSLPWCVHDIYIYIYIYILIAYDLWSIDWLIYRSIDGWPLLWLLLWMMMMMMMMRMLFVYVLLANLSLYVYICIDRSIDRYINIYIYSSSPPRSNLCGNPDNIGISSSCIRMRSKSMIGPRGFVLSNENHSLWYVPTNGR